MGKHAKHGQLIMHFLIAQWILDYSLHFAVHCDHHWLARLLNLPHHIARVRFQVADGLDVFHKVHIASTVDTGILTRAS
jgi:hypothetical protein